MRFNLSLYPAHPMPTLPPQPRSGYIFWSVSMPAIRRRGMCPLLPHIFDLHASRPRDAWKNSMKKSRFRSFQTETASFGSDSIFIRLRLDKHKNFLFHTDSSVCSTHTRLTRISDRSSFTHHLYSFIAATCQTTSTWTIYSSGNRLYEFQKLIRLCTP